MHGRLRNPTSPATREDVAWLAGFYEGEGWCSSRGDGYYRIGFQQVNPEPLIKVHALCGGTVREIQRKNRSYNASPILNLILHGQRAHALAVAIAPYLSSKRREQIEPLLRPHKKSPADSQWGPIYGLTVVS